MILFWSIGMGSVMKKIRRSLFGRYFAPEFAVKESRKLRLTRALTRKLASDFVSLRFEACEFALVFCWLSSSFVLTGTRFGGAVARCTKAYSTLACRIWMMTM